MAKFTDVIAGLTETTDPQGDSDYIVGYDGTSVVKYLINNLPFAASTLALDALGAPSDSTSLNASTDAHGLLLKLDGTSTNFLNGTGAWSVPAGGGGGFTTGDIHMVELYRGELTTDGNFDVSSISQDYDHLLIKVLARSSVVDTVDKIYTYLNNDTTNTNYFGDALYIRDAGAAIEEFDLPQAAYCSGASAPAASFSHIEMRIENYKNTSVNKVVSSRSHTRTVTGQFYIVLTSMEWESTLAVNRVTIQPDGYATNKFITGSFLQIIGVKTEA